MARLNHLLMFSKRSNRPQAATGIALLCIFGTLAIVASHATTTPNAIEAESGVITAPAKIVAVAAASGGSAVQFGSANPTPNGWPTTTNTGWQPTGVTLGAYQGDITIDTDGTVLDSANLGCVTVQANNVTIKRSRIACAGGYWAVKQVGGFNGFTLTDTEVERSTTANVDDLVSIMGGNATLFRNNVHNGSTAFQIAASNVTVQDNYVWDQKNTSGQDHVDALLDNGGTNGVTIRHNALEVNLNQTSAMALYDDAYAGGAETNTIVDDNLFNGGGYCIYPGGSSSTGIQVTGNHFGRKFYSNCGYYGPFDSDLWNTSSSAKNIWTDNVWDDTGISIAAP